MTKLQLQKKIRNKPDKHYRRIVETAYDFEQKEVLELILGELKNDKED